MASIDDMKTSFPEIPAEKFRFTNNRSESDEKFKTKQIGYFGDAWNRFRKNKSSIAKANRLLIVEPQHTAMAPYRLQLTMRNW